MERNWDEVRASLKARREQLGVDRKELAIRAQVDRGTLTKAEETDMAVRASTIGAIDQALAALEEEMGMDVDLQVDARIELGDVKIQLRGTPQAVAEAVRQISLIR